MTQRIAQVACLFVLAALELCTERWWASLLACALSFVAGLLTCTVIVDIVDGKARP